MTRLLIPPLIALGVALLIALLPVGRFYYTDVYISGDSAQSIYRTALSLLTFVTPLMIGASLASLAVGDRRTSPNRRPVAARAARFASACAGVLGLVYLAIAIYVCEPNASKISLLAGITLAFYFLTAAILAPLFFVWVFIGTLLVPRPDGPDPAISWQDVLWQVLVFFWIGCAALFLPMILQT